MNNLYVEGGREMSKLEDRMECCGMLSPECG